MYVCMYVFIYICMYVCMYLSIFVYAYMYVCIYVSICIYIYAYIAHIIGMPLLTCFVCPQKKKTHRYAHIGGMDATSNVLCGQLFGIKVSEKKIKNKKIKQRFGQLFGIKGVSVCVCDTHTVTHTLKF